ncbi:hypothetical protein IQ268_10040 [Oculatella sp. LEGE 06141]|uniref:hypothetical protein n=1 Tax=Oculatella sp. LEGE 06141 TaxID=1828648 RepID=UPI0018807B76|nr:hypothetical protein [Oculatella sp. LEGE 06141]MBE9178900.1 hypothetical protein [Oculatella sp. LEGE 06141]
MHSQIETIFDEAENRYLRTEELNVLSQYVDSLPERMETYRMIRDRELDIMQKVADQLQVEMAQETVEALERSIKNALLALRYCAIGALLNDEKFVQDRLLSWLEQRMHVYSTEAIDTALYQLLNQELRQVLGIRYMRYLSPMLTLVETALFKHPPMTASANGR